MSEEAAADGGRRTGNRRLCYGAKRAVLNWVVKPGGGVSGDVNSVSLVGTSFA